jgi:hypothetical protein
MVGSAILGKIGGGSSGGTSQATNPDGSTNEQQAFYEKMMREAKQRYEMEMLAQKLGKGGFADGNVPPSGLLGQMGIDNVGLPSDMAKQAFKKYVFGR